MALFIGTQGDRGVLWGSSTARPFQGAKGQAMMRGV
jgi:hypothetical protein